MYCNFKIFSRGREECWALGAVFVSLVGRLSTVSFRLFEITIFKATIDSATAQVY